MVDTSHLIALGEDCGCYCAMGHFDPAKFRAMVRQQMIDEESDDETITEMEVAEVKQVWARWKFDPKFGEDRVGRCPQETPGAEPFMFILWG